METVPDGVSSDEPMEQFMALHDLRWTAKGQRGVLWDARTRMFHLEIARVFHKRGWLDLSFLELNGKPLASIYGFIYRDRIYSYLSGMDPHSEWKKWSPASVLLVKNIERAIAMGVEEYDLLRGAEPYKLTLRATETANRHYEIVAPSLFSAIRAGLKETPLESGSLTRTLRGMARAMVLKLRKDAS